MAHHAAVDAVHEGLNRDLGVFGKSAEQRGVLLLGVHDIADEDVLLEPVRAGELGAENLGHLARGDRDLDRVVDLDIRVGVPDGPAVVGDGEGEMLAVGELRFGVGGEVELGVAAGLALDLKGELIGTGFRELAE